MPTVRWLRRFARALPCALLGIGPAAFGQFAPDDEIRLRRDEPLEFKGSVYRQGRQGEIYTVLKYDVITGKVYLLANDNDGKPFALTVPDRAVELLPRDLLIFMQRGAAALRRMDLAAARAAFVKASAGRLGEKMAVDLALHTEELQAALAAIAEAKKARERGLPEIKRLLKNAETADRPDLLFGTDANQVKAEEIRAKARLLQTQADNAVEQAEARFTTGLENFAGMVERLIDAGFLTVAVDVSDGITALSTSQRPGANAVLPLGARRPEIAARIATASDALTKAQALLAARKLHAALAMVNQGLEAEANRAELRHLNARIEADLEKVETALRTIANLRDKPDLAAALAEVEKTEGVVADSEALAALGAEIREKARGKAPGAPLEK